MNSDGSKFYYSRLSLGERETYDRICGALLRFAPSVAVKRTSSTDIERILNAVLFDNPVFFYLNRRGILITQSPLGLMLVFRYEYGKSEAEEMWRRAQERIEGFMQRITPDMKPLAKQIEAHRWMQKNIRIASEPYGEDCFSLVGALVKGECVCEGFSHAYKLICDRLGLPSIIVRGVGHTPDGKSENHAWNITKIDGVTAHIDVTWDAAFGVGAYDYFNLTDEEISVDHDFDKSVYPPCLSDSLGYFGINRLVARDEGELGRIVAENRDKAFFSVKVGFPFDRKTLHRVGFPIGNLRVNDARGIVFWNKN